MIDSSDVSEISRTIQLAVAPVFLLSGIGAMLSVMTNRLSRVIDRARAVEGKLDSASALDAPERIELSRLATRAKLVGRAITLCTFTALLVSAVVACLFLSAFLHFDATYPVAFLFFVKFLLR